MAIGRPQNIALWAVALGGVVVTPAQAAPCVPPPHFVDAPHPELASADQMVSHSEDIDIARPLGQVLDAVSKMSLEHTIRSGASLPGVSGTYPLTQGEFGEPGTRRITCLTDGSTLEEQSLARTRGATAYHFRYVVWNYTSDLAKPIAYGVGDFRYSAVGTGTHVHWTYSFALKRNRFPGYLGGIGDLLFRWTFLDRQYADMMRGTLQGYRSNAERTAPPSP